MKRPRPPVPGRGITFSGESGHEAYDLPALPGDFCWTYGEIFAPALTCLAIDQARAALED